MSPSWKPELSVALCPGRLIYGGAEHAVAGDEVAELARIPARRLRVVLSNHYARYAVLPWSANLKSERDWEAYARHALSDTYGIAADGWDIRISASARGAARVASAVDRALSSSLMRLPQVVSLQPYVMAAYNARRRSIPPEGGWFLAHERDRLFLGLLAGLEWRIARSRQAPPGWTATLADLIDRELAALPGLDCDRVFAVSEEALPERAGRYRIVDLTLTEPRSQAMVLQ